MYIYTERERESHNLVDLFPFQGLGESGIFLGCSVFFAIQDAVSAARRERGLFGPLKLNSPLTPEKIRLACEDRFTKMVCSAHASLSLWLSFINPPWWFSTEEEVTGILKTFEQESSLPAVGLSPTPLKKKGSFFISSLINCIFLLISSVPFPGHISQG